MSDQRSRFLITIFFMLIVVFGSKSQASGQAPRCSTLFADSEKISTILEQAKFVINDFPTTASASRSRLNLINAMGAKDALALFGSDFSTWPLYLGTSPGGHVILAAGRRDGGEIRLLSYKRLDISTEEFQRRRDVDFDHATGKTVTPPNHETVRQWLERTEGSFDLAVSNFATTSKLWLMDAGNSKRLESAVLMNAGLFGKFDRPWIARWTSAATPHPNGKSARVSEPDEIIPLVELLLKMKTGQ